MTSGAFAGFPDGPFRATPIPDQLFSDLLPAIDSLAELQVTLHVFWRTSGGARAPAAVGYDDLLAEPGLLQALAAEPGGARAAIVEGVRRGVERGTLLRGRLGRPPRDLVAPNTARARKALRAVTTTAGADAAAAPPATGAPVVAARVAGADAGVASARPLIFTLYEENIGLVPPLLADELIAAAELYPRSWVEDAFRQAVAYNRRHWRYVRGILERWATEGRERGAAPKQRVAGATRPSTPRQWVQTYKPGERLPDL